MTADEIKLIVIIGLMLLVTISLVLIINVQLQKRFIEHMKNQYVQDNIEIKNYYDESNKKLMDEVLKITKLTAIIDVQEKNAEKNTEHDLFNTFVKLRNSIKDYCIKTMNEISSDRIAIYLFHNGNVSTHGIKFFKMSCVCEKVAIGSGVKEQSIDQANIPVNLFDDMIEQLIDHGKYIIIKDDNLNTSNHRIFISAKKIKYSQAVAIFDNSNNIIGFVLAEMDKDYDKDRANEEKEAIDKLINRLSPILAYSNYTEEAARQIK